MGSAAGRREKAPRVIFTPPSYRAAVLTVGPHAVSDRSYDATFQESLREVGGGHLARGGGGAPPTPGSQHSPLMVKGDDDDHDKQMEMGKGWDGNRGIAKTSSRYLVWRRGCLTEVTAMDG